MERSLFRYIWRHSRRDQVLICGVVLASLPFYFASLDLPRHIVNDAIMGRAFAGGREEARFLDLTLRWPAWLGGGETPLFAGFTVDRLHLLLGLSGLFLIFVLINGAFKYWINVAKGVLGERLLRRLRFELFALTLRFTPEALRSVKASETATIVKDEVEPIGAFSGDAFILPVFLGSQALTALAFILIQNVWLGLMAAAVVCAQVVFIPWIRRELLRLGRRRQLASRRLAGRVGEVIDGMEAVQVHGAERWERAEIGQRLYELFELRLLIYRRKFMAKFLNNLLAQVTPFLFFAVGGTFALQGHLDIGQLVAVIAAYRELPPPLKDLIDWDQQRLDVQVKYDQVAQHFAPERLGPAEEDSDQEGLRLGGRLAVEHLDVADEHGNAVIRDLSFACPLPARIALAPDGAAGAAALARILGGRSPVPAGHVRIGGLDLAHMPAGRVSRRIAYAGPDAILFPGSIRDNLVYGLRRRPIPPADAATRAPRRYALEADRTGNPLDSPADEWVDPAIAGASGPEDLDERLIDLLLRLGLDDDLYRFGLAAPVIPAHHREVADHLVEARERLRARLVAEGLEELVEPFDPLRYNTQATVAENLLFGVPRDARLVGRSLAEQEETRRVLARTGLTREFVLMGLRIAEAMTEMFRGLPPGHPLFEQFSLVGADDLPEFERLLGRRARHRRFNWADATRLIALPLAYVEPRHRLGLLDDLVRARLLDARARMREVLGRQRRPPVAFYDPGQVCAGASLKDNLLFGRINVSVTDARNRVRRMAAAVIGEMGLRPGIRRIGLDHEVGPAGRLLTAEQRACISLGRCVVRRPDLLVAEGAFRDMGEGTARAALDLLLDQPDETTLVATLPPGAGADRFDLVLRFDGSAATLGQPGEAGERRPWARAAE